MWLCAGVAGHSEKSALKLCGVGLRGGGDGGPGVSDGMAVMDTTLSMEMGWEDGLGDSVDDEG